MDQEMERTIGQDAVVLFPPTDQERVMNEMTEGASERLSLVLIAIFRKWPSVN